jgi:hypothetical protein
MDALSYALRKKRGPSLSVYEGLLKNDEVLSNRHFPPLSPWWKKTLKSFYENPRQRLVVRVGRRGGKSSTLCRVIVAELMYGDHHVTPGDVGVFACISVKKAEARERLHTIKSILTALKVGHIHRGDEIRIKDRPLAARVYAASFRTAVGMTCVGIVCDEVARWRDEDTGANPAKEVLASVRPSLATMVNSHEFLSSSPWSTLDAHYEAYELGNTSEQLVAHAPTWVANPTISQSRCEQLEPDELTREREYGAIPMKAGLSSFFDGNAIEDTIDQDLHCPLPPMGHHRMTAGADFGFKRDSSAIAVVAKDSDGHMHKLIDYMELKPGPNEPLKPSETVAAFASVLKRNYLRSVMADHHYREAVSEYLAQNKMGLISAPGGALGNMKVYVNARSLIHQGRVRIPDHQQLRRDLLEVQHRPTPNGGLRIILPRRTGGGHADLVSAFVLALYQRGGAAVPEDALLPNGWTRNEMDECDKLARELKGEDGVQYTEQEWIT